MSGGVLHVLECSLFRPLLGRMDVFVLDQESHYGLWGGL